MHSLWKITRVDGSLELAHQIVPTKVKRGLFSPSCTSLCGKPLMRPHFACMFCRVRKVHFGKMQNPEKIAYTYVLYSHRGRRFSRVKDLLLNFVLNIAEALAN